MKQNTRILIAAMAVVGIIGGGSAHAFRGDGNCGPQAMERSPGKFASNRLQKLHDDLKLAPTQEAAWKAWSEPMLQQAEKMGDLRSEREAMMKLPAPERMEKMLERMKEHQKRMEAHLESTKGFYAGLSAEQKKVFDAFQPFAGRQGGGKDGSRSPGGQGKAGAQGAN
jgi:hypothetical protein